jgi:hypothetical protein
MQKHGHHCAYKEEKDIKGGNRTSTWQVFYIKVDIVLQVINLENDRVLMQLTGAPEMYSSLCGQRPLKC